MWIANKLGLYDISANVYSWTMDCYHNIYEGAPADGSPWASKSCPQRVMRGGSWADAPVYLRGSF